MRTASSAQRSRSSSLNRRRASNIARLIGIESTSQSNRAALFDIRRSLGNLRPRQSQPAEGRAVTAHQRHGSTLERGRAGAFEIVRLFELDDSLIEGLADRTTVSVNSCSRTEGRALGAALRLLSWTEAVAQTLGLWLGRSVVGGSSGTCPRWVAVWPRWGLLMPHSGGEAVAVDLGQVVGEHQ
jgi:hypothetical protein